MSKRIYSNNIIALTQNEVVSLREKREYPPIINGVYQIDINSIMPFGKYKNCSITSLLIQDHDTAPYLFELYKYKSTNYYKYEFSERLKTQMLEGYNRFYKMKIGIDDSDFIFNVEEFFNNLKN